MNMRFFAFILTIFTIIPPSKSQPPIELYKEDTLFFIAVAFLRLGATFLESVAFLIAGLFLDMGVKYEEERLNKCRVLSDCDNRELQVKV